MSAAGALSASNWWQYAKRFVRIRHYGLLAGRNVNTRLAYCHQLLPDTTNEFNNSAIS